MWFKKKKQEFSRTKFDDAVADGLKACQLLLANMQIEIDAIKKRLRKKLIPKAEDSEEIEEEPKHKGLLTPRDYT